MLSRSSKLRYRRGHCIDREPGILSLAQLSGSSDRNGAARPPPHKAEFVAPHPGQASSRVLAISPYNEENLRSSSRAASENSFSGSIPAPLFIISCNSGSSGSGLDLRPL